MDIKNAKQERHLMIANLIASVLALGAIGLAIYLGVVHAHDLSAAREDACRLFRGLVLAATPHSKRPEALAYIAHTPLHDCHRYATMGVK